MPVATLSPATLLTRLGALNGPTLLMLDAPGAELTVLQGLRDAGALDQLTAIELICTEEPQYLGSTGRALLQALLEEAGFALTSTNLTDPDWPHLSFRIDLKSREIADLTAQLQSLSAAAQTLTEQHAAEAAELHAELTAARDTIAALTRQMQDQTAALSAQTAQQGLHVADLQAVIADLQEQLATLNARKTTEPPVDNRARAEAAIAAQTIALQTERIKELEFRQTLARDELRRAEGQLDLIKDLLLRGERL